MLTYSGGTYRSGDQLCYDCSISSDFTQMVNFPAVVNKVETWLNMFVSMSTIVLYDGWPSENHVIIK